MRRWLNSQEIQKELYESDSESDNSGSEWNPSPPTPKLVLVESETPGPSRKSPADIDVPKETSSQNQDEPITVDLDSDNEEEAGCPTPAKTQKLDQQGRGRKVLPIWNEFTRKGVAEKTKVLCNWCGEKVSGKPERMERHLKKCEKYQTSVSGSPKPVPERSKSITPKRKTVSKSVTNISSHFDKVTQAGKAKLDEETAKYIYGTNLPFSHVENPRFKSYVRKLRPAYQLPTRKAIGGPLLDLVYNQTITECKEKLAGKIVTIMQDGWSTNTHQPVIAHSLTTGDEAVFINAISSGDQEKTAEYCANLLLLTIDEIIITLGVKVAAVVTDNCNSMTRMREIIEASKPDIYTYGCHSHLLNLVGKKLTPVSLQQKIEVVQRFFRNHDRVGAALKSKCGTRPILANETRWNSWIDCFDNYLKNHTKYLETSRMDELKIDFSSVLPIINDGEIYNLVKVTVEYLRPIQMALDDLQKSTSTLADGVFQWLELQKKFTFSGQEIKAYFDKQFNLAVTGVGLAAYMLHPKYRGKGISSVLLSKAETFLKKEDPFIVIIAAMLNQKSDVWFPAIMFTDGILEQCSASTWWSSQLPYEKIQPKIIEVAKRLMNLPASSADIERHFSTLGNIISKRRASLGIEKAGKLCTVYKHLAGSCAPGDDGDDWEEN